jgi:hypothetical protein
MSEIAPHFMSPLETPSSPLTIADDFSHIDHHARTPPLTSGSPSDVHSNGSPKTPAQPRHASPHMGDRKGKGVMSGEKHDDSTESIVEGQGEDSGPQYIQPSELYVVSFRQSAKTDNVSVVIL